MKIMSKKELERRLRRLSELQFKVDAFYYRQMMDIISPEHLNGVI